MTESNILFSIVVIFMINVKPVFPGNVSTSDPCDTVQCENGGTCNPETIICQCTPGYGGQSCEERTFHCSTDACLHGGTCAYGNGKCHCVEPYYGIQCQNTRNSWTNPTHSQKQTRSTIVSVAFACVILLTGCFLVGYVNVRRSRRRRADAAAEEEVRNAIQVDGPPRLRLPENMKRAQRNMEREDSGCFGSQSMNLNVPWPSFPKHKRTTKKRLQGVATSPAVLQGTVSQDSDYSAVDNGKDLSGVTIQETSLVSIPPAYDDVIELRDSDNNGTDSSGLFMRCTPDLICDREPDDIACTMRDNGMDRCNSGRNLVHAECGIEKGPDNINMVNECEDIRRNDFISFTASSHQAGENLYNVT
ncbi:uncharacterized protein LOC144439993 [Glandiceps talaboti]